MKIYQGQVLNRVVPVCSETIPKKLQTVMAASVVNLPGNCRSAAGNCPAKLTMKKCC